MPDRLRQWLKDWGTPGVVVAVGVFLWNQLDRIESDLSAEITAKTGQLQTDLGEVRKDIAGLRNDLRETTAVLNERIDATNRRIDLANRRMDGAYDRMMADNPVDFPSPGPAPFGNAGPETKG